MDNVIQALEYVVFAVKMVSVLVLVIGLLLCIKSLLVAALAKERGTKSHIQIQLIKNHLGWYVLLGLEILIIADIIETIVSPALLDIARLAAIVAIRTIISFFLNREIKETDSVIEKSQGSD